MASSVGASSSQSTTNATTNTSTVTGNGSVTITVGNFSGLQSWGRVWIGGQNYDIAGPTSMSQGSSWSWSASRTYTHDANGYRGAVGVSVEFWVDGTSYHAGSADGGTQGAVDYDRKPAVPGIPTANIVLSTKTIVVNWAAVTSLAGTPTYYIQYASASNGGAYSAWSTEVSTTSTSYSFSGLARGVTYKFHVRAVNTDGNSGYGSDSIGYFLPAGGKIYDAGAWRQTTIGKKFDGTNWVDLSTAKKYDGTTWTDLTT